MGRSAGGSRQTTPSRRGEASLACALWRSPRVIGRVRAARSFVARSRACSSAALLAFLGVGACCRCCRATCTGPLGAGDVAVGVVIGAFALTAVVARPVGGPAGRRARAARRGRSAALLSWPRPARCTSSRSACPACVVARLVLGVGEGCGVHRRRDLGGRPRAGGPARRRRSGCSGSRCGAGWRRAADRRGAAPRRRLRRRVGVRGARAAASARVIARAPARRRRRRREPPGAGGPLVPPEALAPGHRARAGQRRLRRRWPASSCCTSTAAASATAPRVFTAFAASVVVTRLLLGRLPDRLGAAHHRDRRPGCAEAAGLALLGARAGLAGRRAGRRGGHGHGLLAAVPLAGADRRRAQSATTAAAPPLGIFTAFFDIGVGLGGAAGRRDRRARRATRPGSGRRPRAPPSASG